MTKSELINRFSKTIGLSESDAKPFFELLLKRISEELKSGQSIFITEFGYFHLIKGKIKLPLTELESEELDEEKIDIILYSETEKLGESEANGFVFNVPVFEEDEFKQIDSHFSLSIDKPLIPLLGVLDQKTYIPKSAQDQRRYLESKIEQIIANSKVVVSEEEFPTLIIDASSYNSDHINLEKAKDELESLLSDELPEKSVDEEKDEKAAKNIAWDFGDFYTKKISAESVFQLAHQIINNPPVKKQDTNDVEKELKVQEIEEENILDKLLENESDNEIVTEEFEESKPEEPNEPENTRSETELEITDKQEDETNTFKELNPELSEEIEQKIVEVMPERHTSAKLPIMQLFPTVR